MATAKSWITSSSCPIRLESLCTSTEFSLKDNGIAEKRIEITNKLPICGIEKLKSFEMMIVILLIFSLIVSINFCAATSKENYPTYPEQIIPSDHLKKEASMAMHEETELTNLKVFIGNQLGLVRKVFQPLTAEQIRDNLEREASNWIMFLNHFEFRRQVTMKALDAMFLQKLEQFIIDNDIDSSSESSDSDMSSNYASSSNESSSLSSTEIFS